LTILLSLRSICVTNDHGYVLFVVITRGTTNHSGPHQFTRGTTYPSGAHQFTRGTTYPSGAHQFTRGTTYHSGAHQFTPAFSVIRVAQFLFFCAVFVYYCLSFFLWALHCLCFYWFTTADYPLVSSIYDCWLPFCIFYLRLLITLWYLLFTTADYPLVSFIYDCWLPFGIFYLRLLITLWYLQTCLNQTIPVFGRVRVAHLFSFLCCISWLFVLVLGLVFPMLPSLWIVQSWLTLRFSLTFINEKHIVIQVILLTITIKLSLGERLLLESLFICFVLLCVCTVVYYAWSADYPLVSSIYDCWLPFGIFYFRLLITLWYLLFTTTDYPFVSSIYDCWLPFCIFYLRILITLWYLLIKNTIYHLVSSNK
jgi:hypothetical protein